MKTGKSCFLFRILLIGVIVFAWSESGACVTPKSQQRAGAQKKIKRVKKVQRAKTSSVRDTVTPLFERNMPPPGSGGQFKNDDFYRKRAWPNESIDPESYRLAVEQARRMPVYKRGGKQSTQAAQRWAPIGPFNIGGRITALATHPVDSNVLYAAAASGGLWKTMDHGETWRCLTDTFASQPIGAVTIDPQDPETIYIGQGECNFSGDSYPGNGLWKSVNGGDSWQFLGLGKTQYIYRILLDPRDRKVIYVDAPGPRALADTNRGVYKSVDGGLTWSHLFWKSDTGKKGVNVFVVDLAMNPRNPDELVAFAYDRSNAGLLDGGIHTGVWHTIDGGAAWSRIDTLGLGLPNGVIEQRLSRGALHWVDEGETSTLYVAFSRADSNLLTKARFDANFFGLYSATDVRGTWTKLQDSSLRIPYKGNGVDSVNLLYRQGDYNFFLAGNPHRPQEIYIGGIDVVRSTNRGVSFENITRSYPAYFQNDRTQHSDQHALAITAAKGGDDLFLGSDGGVFLTRDFGTTWRQLKGMEITMFYALEPWWTKLPTKPTVLPEEMRIIGGTQDNGTVALAGEHAAGWDWINRGDGGVAIAHPTDSTQLITSLQLGKIFYRNTLDTLKPNIGGDSGYSDAARTIRWHVITRPLLNLPGRLTDSTESCAFIAPIVVEPTDFNKLYTVREHVYHAWIDPVNPDSTKWFKWSPQLGGYAGNPSRWYYGTLEALALGPADARGRHMIWAGGYSSSAAGGNTSLWRTRFDPNDRPDTTAPKWVKIVSGLPGGTVSSIVPDRSDTTVAFVSVLSSTPGKSVYTTTNGGTRWTSITGNLPASPVSRIVIDTASEMGNPLAKNQTLIVATDVGVFVTTNGGTAWARLGEGLPQLVVEDLRIYKNLLIAGTHGRSAWAIDISDLRAEPRSGVSSSTVSPQFSIYPSVLDHANRRVTLKIDGTTRPLAIEVVTVTGTVVATLSAVQSADGYQLELPPSLTPGPYILHATDAGHSVGAQKLTIIR